jgi:hypothetical protein
MVRERFATGKNYHPFIVSNTRTLADQDMLQFALRSLFLASKTGYRYENGLHPRIGESPLRPLHGWAISF